ncbi:MAG: methyltransferase domain-containing protein [Pseudomonadota bacterium]
MSYKMIFREEAMPVAVKSLDARRYAQTFAVFIERSHEYPAMNRRLVEVTNTLPPNFTCLDVGAGTGKVLTEWLQAGGQKPGIYLAVEPNALHAPTLRDTCDALGVVSTVDERPFDEHFPIGSELDFALFSHCLYWPQHPAACVAHAYNALKPGGVLVAFLQGPYAIHSINHLFEPEFDRDQPSGPHHGFSSAELLRELRDIGLEAELFLDPTPHDLSDLMGSDNEQELNEYLSFCLQIEFAELSGYLREDILAYLKAACVEQDGKRLWYAPNATVMLKKA